MSYDRGSYRQKQKHEDNDEGFHFKQCFTCNRHTEHGIAEGCVPCANKDLTRRGG